MSRRPARFEWPSADDPSLDRFDFAALPPVPESDPTIFDRPSRPDPDYRPPELGLRKFGLGYTPASVTTSPSSHAAAVFAVLIGLAVLVCLALAAT